MRGEPSFAVVTLAMRVFPFAGFHRANCGPFVVNSSAPLGQRSCHGFLADGFRRVPFGIVADIGQVPTSVLRIRLDIAVWQRLPKCRSTFGRDLRVVEAKICEAGQSPEMLQTGIGHLRVAEVENCDVGHSLEMLQTDIADLRVVEIQPFEVGQSLEMLQAGVGDLRLVEEEEREFGE